MTSVPSGLRKTYWGPTFVLNLMRAAAAGVVIGVIGVVGALSDEATPAGNVVPFLFTPVMWPLADLLFYLPLGVLAMGLAKAGVPWVGLFVALCSLLIAIGDPILWLLNKVLPERIPIVRDLPFRFFNFTMLYLVLKPAAAGVCRSCQGEVSTVADVCPHCGEPDPWERAPTAVPSGVADSHLVNRLD